MEIALPEGVTYRAGDYLGVMPRNSAAQVERAMARFGLEREARIRLRRTRAESLAADRPARAGGRLLGDYFDLQETATRAQIQALAEHNECPPRKGEAAGAVGQRRESAATTGPRCWRSTNRCSICWRSSRPARCRSRLAGNAAAAAAALLLHLVLAARGRARQPDRGRAEGPGLLRPRHLRRRVLQLPGRAPGRAAVHAFVSRPKSPSGCRPIRARRSS